MIKNPNWKIVTRYLPGIFPSARLQCHSPDPADSDNVSSPLEIQSISFSDNQYKDESDSRCELVQKRGSLSTLNTF